MQSICILLVLSCDQWLFSVTRYKVLVRLRRSRALVRNVVKSHVFFWFMKITILLNLIILLCNHYPAPSWLDRTIGEILLNIIFSHVQMSQPALLNPFLSPETTNYIFTSVYIVEICLKLFGLGFNKYLTSHFNKLNFFVSTFVFIIIYILLCTCHGGFKESFLLSCFSIADQYQYP